MQQADLFGGTLPIASGPPPPPPKPRVKSPPERLRRHLMEILADLQRAERMFWKPWDEKWWVDIYRGIAADLEPEEAADWGAKLDAELTRLKAASY